MVPCRAPRLRGRHRGRRPSGPDPGNAGGGNVNEQRSGYDVVIVGGGVIGLSCAWRAARRGAGVVVVERSQPPAGATRVAAGMLAPVGELAFGEPELLKMTVAAAELYPGFVAELEAASGISTGYRRDGALHVALYRDEAAELRRGHPLPRSPRPRRGCALSPDRRLRARLPGAAPRRPPGRRGHR